MAESYIWGNLNRSVTDSTLIDEAIDEAITAHNDNPDAHFGPDGSLESHRMSEVIDHRAESVVNDKIRSTARRYVAIVDPNSEFDFDTLAEAVEYAKGIGGGDIFIKRGTHYLTSDIKISPTISFYGEGAGETQIESVNSSGNALIYYTTANSSSGIGYFNSSLDGYDSFKWSSYMESTNPPVVGQFLSIVGDGNYKLQVTEYNSATDIVYLEDALHDLGDESEVELLAGYQLVNGASELTVITNDKSGFADWYPGMAAVLMNLTSTPITIERLGDNKFKLSNPYTGATTLRPGEFQYLGQTTINFEGLSTTRGNYAVNVGGNSGNARNFVQNCQNIIVTNLNSVYYQNCKFKCIAGSTIALRGSSVWDNCLFIASSNASAGMLLTGKSVLKNCIFLANGYTNHLWLNGTCQEANIDGCTFEKQSPIEIFTGSNSSSATGLRMSNCWWTFGSSGTFALRLVRSMVTGCSFEMGSANAPQLSATSSKSVFANNRCSKTPVNNGTSNLVVNNLVVT